MPHFAEVENGIVKRVVVANEQYDNLSGKEWCEKNLGGEWVKTSYNTYGGKHRLGGIPFRKNYAGIGYTYDQVRDAFIPPKPFNSWILDEETCQYKSPIEYPKDGKPYEWDEETVGWKIIPDDKGVIL